jgi:c-di-GMP-binding flagellar brake protein YcgR
MSEQRREERKKVMAFVPVHHIRTGTILGYLNDLTLQGAMVIGNHALEKDTRITLGIEFPGELEGTDVRRMVIPARVARCEPDEAPGSYKLGFEFVDLNEEQNRLIQALLDRYHFRHQMQTD